MSPDSQTRTSRYLDASLPVEARVRDLLAQMTVDEKVAQLGSLWVFQLFENMHYSEAQAAPQLQHGIGQITRIGGASNLAPVKTAELANQIQAFLVKQTRLGIPAIVHEECCSGYMARGATLFPQAIGIASTWDAELTEAMGDVIRTQMRSVGGHQALAPVLDVVRDPRWGRVEETFGEDPYLVAELGTAYVKGIQGSDWREGIAATGKHFVGYGLPEGGRNWGPVLIGQREMLEVFVRPFEVAIKVGGLASMMNAYHELDGVVCGRSKALLDDLLRGQIGFDGLLVSDYFSVDMLYNYHHVASDKQDAARQALEAGIDVELPATDCFGEPLKAALASGKIDMTLVDRAVSRVLDLKFRLGLFEKPYVDAGRVPEVFDTAAQRELAYKLAQKSMVLLQNDGNLLPLKKDLKSIAVIGPNADTVRNLMGDYAYPAHIETLMEQDALGAGDMPVRPEALEPVERPVEMITILDGIRARVSPGTTVTYARGCDVMDDSAAGFDEAVALAREADVAILVMGGKSGLTNDCTCGEARDRAEIGLPGVQLDLVKAVHATGTPVVLVLLNGRPYTLPWEAEHIPAILEAWLPGEEGAAAVADVLFGDVNPGGKLPMTFPRAVGQIPLFYNHKPSGGRSHWKVDYVFTKASPQFPFGHGLSYTDFALKDLRIDREQARAGETVAISVGVTNTGTRPGDEVVQLYVRDVAASVTRPVKELKGFKRITLGPGETKTVTFGLAVNQLAFYDMDMRLVVEPGRIDVMVGNSSANITCQGAFEIVGETAAVTGSEAYLSQVQVG